MSMRRAPTARRVPICLVRVLDVEGRQAEDAERGDGEQQAR